MVYVTMVANIALTIYTQSLTDDGCGNKSISLVLRLILKQPLVQQSQDGAH